MKNIFAQKLGLKASLESSDALLDPSDVFGTGDTINDSKPGVTEAKGTTDENDEVLQLEAELTDENEMEAAEFDAIALSQEQVVSLEHLNDAIGRFSRHAFALEEITDMLDASTAEPAEGDEEGQPGEGMTPEAIAAIATAIDSAGVGEPVAENVALEAFDFDTRVATESFSESLKERASAALAAVSAAAKKIYEGTVERLKRLANFFKGLSGVYKNVLADKDVLIAHAGKNFANEKREKSIAGSFFTPSSIKTPVAVVDASLKEMSEVMDYCDNKLAPSIQKLQRTYAQEAPSKVIEQINATLAVVAQNLTNGHTKQKHSANVLLMKLPEKVTAEQKASIWSPSISVEENARDFDASLKVASVAEVEKLLSSAVRVTSALGHVWNEIIDGNMYKDDPRRMNGDKDASVVHLGRKYSAAMTFAGNVWASSIWESVQGAYLNHRAAARWAKASVSEAKQMAKAA